LIVGGSRGIGDLAAAAADVLATGLMTPVVACGSNDRLRAHLHHAPGVVALGWRDDLSTLVAAATCVLQNAGGMTSLESLAAGTPTLTYRPIPGHGTTNAQALDLAGLVPWILDEDELQDALARILVSPDSFGLPHEAPPVTDVVARTLSIAGDPPLVAA
jgi:UDP-N-acetylglucosamine:LPS N-acetylglucosamine transferase